MANIKRLRNVAAGLLSSFISRNNDVERAWALGMLYNEAADGGMRLDLLAWQASTPGPAGHTVACNYGEMLRRALHREGIDRAELSAALVELRFDTAVRPVYYHSGGEPFDCSITLRTRDGQVVARQAHGRCWRHQPYVFSRGPGGSGGRDPRQ